MPLPDKILMRKIKKREKKKIKILSQQLKTTEENSIDTDKLTRNDINRYSENSTNETVLPLKKKKKKQKDKKEIQIEEEDMAIDSSKMSEMDSSENDCEENNQNGKINGYKQVPKHLDSSIASNQKFSSLEGKICEPTLRALKEMGYTTMTEIQAKAIPPLLEGKSLVGTARTGSGKTLAFLIPAIEFVYKLQYKPRNGTGAIILVPTRELAMQTYGVLTELMKYNKHTYGLVMGGGNKSKETQKLFNGVNILVATPGRLLDHMQNNPDFVYDLAVHLVIDEFDKLLEIGFEEEVKQIMKKLPHKEVRQTVVFSATKTQRTEAFRSISLKDCLYVGVDDHKEQATVDTLEQGYLICPPDQRLVVLFTFLKKCRTRKVMVFFSTCSSVDYHNSLFNFIDLPVMSIHGKQEQSKRTSTFFKFCNAESPAILLCTDIATRGLDIPAVDWIVQYDPPDDPKDYIHRVGRTARGLGTSGRALLFLRAEELGFLDYLKQSKVTLNEYECYWDKAFDIQSEVEKLISRNRVLHQYAKDAYQSYLRAYGAHRLKTIFDINTIDLAKTAKSFGFANPPAVELRGTSLHQKRGKRQKKGFGNINKFKKGKENERNYVQKGFHKNFQS